MRLQRIAQPDFLSPTRKTFRGHREWLDWLHAELPKPKPAASAPLVVDLFAGCGGLSTGFECAGFRTMGYEMKAAAVASYNANLDGGCTEATLEIGDPAFPAGAVDVLVGGPPCQPFSQIGYQRGSRDPRDGFPVFLDAVNRLRPKIAIIENVRGLLFRNKDYLLAAAAELQRFGYQVDARLMNTAQYGVPQVRERVIIVASRVGWEWPEPAVEEPVTAGVALGDLAAQVTDESKFMTESMDRYVASYEKASKCVTPRDLHLDRPSRTVTCRNFGASTADMLRIRLPDGRRRMLHTREGARLMSFPDWFDFKGGPYDRAEQIGNAVAPLLGLAVARQAARALEGLMARPKTSKVMATPASAHEETPVETMRRQAQTLLKDVGVNLRDMTPIHQKRTPWALLAVAHLKPGDSWADAKSWLEDGTTLPLSQREILEFWNQHYGTRYADSSYDDVKRKNLIHLEAHGLVVPSVRKPDAPINDPTRGHSLSLEGLALVRAYGTPEWPDALARFREAVPDLARAAAERRRRIAVPVALPGGAALALSPGAHNSLQQSIVRDFFGKFVPDAETLYLADAAKKRGEEGEGRKVFQEKRLLELGVPPFMKGQKLVDVIAYSPSRRWLFLVEAVHSSNPLTPVRHQMLRQAMRGCRAGRVYVTAFQGKKDFRKWAAEISWETEAWLADDPDHLIHFNGDRFLGPHEGDEGC